MDASDRHDERAAWGERRRAAEAEQAAAMLRAFVAEAGARGLAPEPLRARSWDGRASYRTPLRGWYLKQDRSVAVGEDGAFYVLSVPSSAWARVAGTAVDPSAPPLVVGAGGRDGESVPLADLLAGLLDRAG